MLVSAGRVHTVSQATRRVIVIVPSDPEYSTIQYRCTAQHMRYLRRLATAARKRGHEVGDSPLQILEWAVSVAGSDLGLTMPPRTANTHGGVRRGKTS